MVEADHHPQEKLVTALPKWILKALEPHSSTVLKAGVIQWSADVLQEGCGGDQPNFSAPSHAHMTMLWGFRGLLRCLIRRNGKNNGTWGRGAEGGGGGCGDPCGVQP